MPGFSLDDYEPVADRIERFWKDHPKGSIVTNLEHQDDKRFVVKAYVCRETTDVVFGTDRTNADATGYAEEVIGSTNVNRTSALENCETSAIGRALANLGYAVKNRASREEMVKAQPTPRPRSGGKVTPTPQAPQIDVKAPKNDLGPDVAGEVKRMKNWAFTQLSGDVDRTKAIWEQVLSTYELDGEGMPDKDSLQFVESDLSIAVGEALTLELVEP